MPAYKAGFQCSVLAFEEYGVNRSHEGWVAVAKC